MFIKIDVEGHELAVLRGAETTLRERRPWLVVEMLATPERNLPVYEYASLLGYALFGICKEGVFRMTLGDFSEHRGFTDFLFIPEESLDPCRNYLSYNQLKVLS